MNKVIILFAGMWLLSCAPAKPPAAQAPPRASEYERVSFPSLDADLAHGVPTRVQAMLFRPAGPGPFPAVVALHGASGLERKGQLFSNYRDWGMLLRDAGYLALFPDSFNSRGYKDGVASMKHSPVRPDQERVRDAYGALRFLQSLPEVRPDRIGVLGWSHGGSTVLAAVDAGLGLRPPEPERNFRVAVAFYPGSWRQLSQLSWRPAVPLTILIGLHDDWTPAAGCVRLGERVRATGQALEVVTYPGANHGFDAPGVPVHVRTGIDAPGGRATVGTDPEARKDALERVFKIFQRALK
jgi:dienelactone hydrolase